MSNASIAVLLSWVVMAGSANATWAAPNTAPAHSVSVSRMASPLPPGGAAGVKQAQGTDWSGPLLGAAVTGGIFLTLLLLVGDDDTGPVTSTTTSQ